MGRYVMIFLAFVSITGVLIEADIQHCEHATMPRLKRFSVPRMNRGETAEIRLEMESDVELRITWIKSISPGELAHQVPMLSSSDYNIINTHSGRIWSSVIYILKVEEEDQAKGRFQAEIDVLHPCNTFTMQLSVSSRWIDEADSDITVRVKAFPIWSNPVHIGDFLHGGLQVESHRDIGLSTNKWTRYISRTGVRQYLFVLDGSDAESQNRSRQFFTSHSSQKLSDTKFIGYSNMSLRPFLQRDQGVFKTRFNYKIGRTITVSVSIFMELRYSDSLGAALKVKTCSSEALNEPDQDLLQLPVEAGYDNCIKCFAHGAPLPKIYLAEINPDLSTGITYVRETRFKVYGHMAKSATYLLPMLNANQEQHYVCTAGRKHYVSSLVFKLVAFNKVNITFSTPKRETLQRLGGQPLNFNCKASGVPLPTMKFYSTDKNSYVRGRTPEEQKWKLIDTTPDDIIIYEESDERKNTLSAMLTLPNPSTLSDYACFASNRFSSDSRLLRMDDY